MTFSTTGGPTPPEPATAGQLAVGIDELPPVARCSQCDRPPRPFWGMCEQHAREAIASAFSTVRLHGQTPAARDDETLSAPYLVRPRPAPRVSDHSTAPGPSRTTG